MVTQEIAVLFYDKDNEDETQRADYTEFPINSESKIESVLPEHIKAAFESQYRSRSFRAQDYEFFYATTNTDCGKHSKVWISITDNSTIPLDNNSVRILYRKLLNTPDVPSSTSKATIQAKLEDNHPNENLDQLAILKQLISDVLTSYGVKINHNKFYINNTTPDIVLNIANKPEIPYYCSFFVELLLRDVETDEESKGRVIKYNELILEKNPCREYIISMLTDLNECVLIKTKRNQHDFEHIESLPFVFWDEGLKVLKRMMQEPDSVGYTSEGDVSFNIGNFNYTTTKYLGSGSTSTCYRFAKYENDELDDSEKYVVKVFKEGYFEEDFNQENRIFETIQTRTKNVDVPQFMKKICHKVFTQKEDKTLNRKKRIIRSIVLSPSGVRFRVLNPSRLDQMVECVEMLHQYGVIHRDLSPHHFMVRLLPDNTEQVFDF